MAVVDAVAAALLVTLSGALLLHALRSYRRYRRGALALLGIGFGFICIGGIATSLFVLGLAFSGGFPMSLVASVQVAALVAIYAASFPPR